MRESRVSNGNGQDGARGSMQAAVAVSAASQIADPILARLYAYWDGKRGRRRYPGRSDLDPVDIPILLSNVFLVAVRRHPFELVFRLAGTVLTECYGGEITGLRLVGLVSSGASELQRQAARTVRTGRPVLLSGPLRTQAEAYRAADHLLLPLGESPDRVDMLIGGAIFRTYPVGARPDRGCAGSRLAEIDTV